MKITLTSMALGCFIASTGVQAASIQSMTIEEIGVGSGGLGTSTLQSVGGEATIYNNNNALFANSGFVSAGSVDGKIIMGIEQANDAFTLGVVLLNTYPGDINSLRGAPRGSIINGVMNLDISGFTTEYLGNSYSISPDNNMTTSISMIDANHYYYTADWTHLIKNGEVLSISTGDPVNLFNGWLMTGHLEGIATLTPVPEAETYAMMLAGLSLVGFMAKRRRKQLSPKQVPQ
ncbi:MAG: PEP-CTERM sorting domain-containing protein [Thiobacillus sp.]|nr:PEP-CTERM sorting domain-containing protein [Thiobacillus sp.]